MASSHVAAVLPITKPAVVKRVEDELAGEAEQVQGPAAILRHERAGCGEVLAVHDFRRLVVAVVLAGVAGAEAGEGVAEVAQLLVRVTGLAQLVAARVPQRLDAVPHRRVGVVPQPLRRLHDVGVGIVHDQPRRVVRHLPSLAAGIWAPSPPPTHLGAVSASPCQNRRPDRTPPDVDPPGIVVDRQGDVAEWFRQGPAKPCTGVRFPSSPPAAGWGNYLLSGSFV